MSPNPSDAARALQRLSVRSRWGKLTPAQRSEAMKRVRAAATTRHAGTVQPPADASAAGSIRIRRAQEEVCQALESFGGISPFRQQA